MSDQQVAVDIGNTHVVMGYFLGGELKNTWRFASDPSRTVDEYALTIKGVIDSEQIKLTGQSKVIVCCVVPSLSRVFLKLFQKYFDIEAQLVESGNLKQIEIDCDDPSSVGADRAVNALAARESWGAPGVVVDFGTATTFDVIAENGNYQGGIIAPGLITASEALSSKAAMLPGIEISDPPQLIGKNTQDSMLSGIVYGYAGLVDGILERLEQETGFAGNVTATGGLARMMNNYSAKIDRVVPELTLLGLKLLLNSR